MPGPDDRTYRYAPSIGRRLLLVLIVFLITGSAGYALTERLYAQVLYEWAGSDLKVRQPTKAVERLEKAISLQPSDPILWMRLGDAYHLLATMRPVEDGLKHIREAQTAFATAFDLNPLDAEAAYRTAVEAALEEKVSADLYEKSSDSPYNARRYFEAALRLWPGSVKNHHAYTRYLNAIEDSGRLVQVVESTVRLHPRIVLWLKGGLIWTPEVRAAAIHGLEKAISEGRSADTAQKMKALIADIPETNPQSGKK